MPTIKFGPAESGEVSLKGNVYDFSVDYNAIDKSDILNIYWLRILQNNVLDYSTTIYWIITF